MKIDSEYLIELIGSGRTKVQVYRFVKMPQTLHFHLIHILMIKTLSCCQRIEQMKIDGECLIELIESCRNKIQVYRFVRMPQLHTSLCFHLCQVSKLLLLHPRRDKEPIAVSAVLLKTLGKSK